MSTTVNVWRIRQLDGEEIVLASDLLKHRQWMEQDELIGFTPWMHLLREDVDGSSGYWAAHAKVGGLVVDGRARVEMAFVASVKHWRIETEGSLPE